MKLTLCLLALPVVHGARARTQAHSKGLIHRRRGLPDPSPQSNKEWTGGGVSVIGGDVPQDRCSVAYAIDWAHQFQPKSQYNAGAVGGCVGNTHFVFNKHPMLIKQFTAFDAGHIVRAIRIIWEDDSTQMIGAPQGGDRPVSVTFAPGETLTGDLILRGSPGGWFRLGYIEFTTSQGQTLKAGHTGAPPHYFNTQNGWLGGFFGNGGDEIGSLGVILWKPLVSMAVVNIDYPQLPSLPPKAPDSLFTKTLCNAMPVERLSPEFHQSVTTFSGSESCLEVKTSVRYSVVTQLTVKAAIPKLSATWDTTAKWERSKETTFKNCETRTTTLVQNFTIPAVTLAPRSSEVFSLTQWQGKLDGLLWRGQLELQFKDGGVLTRAVSGTYQGTSYTRIQQSFSNYTENVTFCP